MSPHSRLQQTGNSILLAQVFAMVILFSLTRTASAQLQSETISVKNGGSLTYSVFSRPVFCGHALPKPPAPPDE